MAGPQRRNYRVLPPIHANPGIAAGYRRQLEALIDEMTNSLEYWLCARWKADPPIMALDATPADLMARTMRELTKRWQTRFDDIARTVARRFAAGVTGATSNRIDRLLSEAGWRVNFTVSPGVRDVMAASVTENVGLIKSIAQQHLSKVEGIVMRNVQTGNDLASMTREIRKAGGVTRDRAAFIARDQTNKMTAVITRARQEQAGIKRAVWMHSHAGETPRPEHLAFDGHIYNVSEGVDFHNGEGVVWPGTAINCRCTSRPVIEGFE